MVESGKICSRVQLVFWINKCNQHHGVEYPFYWLQPSFSFTHVSSLIQRAVSYRANDLKETISPVYL